MFYRSKLTIIHIVTLLKLYLTPHTDEYTTNPSLKLMMVKILRWTSIIMCHITDQISVYGILNLLIIWFGLWSLQLNMQNCIDGHHDFITNQLAAMVAQLVIEFPCKWKVGCSNAIRYRPESFNHKQTNDYQKSSYIR